MLRSFHFSRRRGLSEKICIWYVHMIHHNHLRLSFRLFLKPDWGFPQARSSKIQNAINFRSQDSQLERDGAGENGFVSISIVIKGFLSSNYVCIVLYMYIYIQVCIIDGIISVIAHTMYILSAKSCINLYYIFFLAVVTPNHNYHSTYIHIIHTSKGSDPSFVFETRQEGSHSHFLCIRNSCWYGVHIKEYN